MISICLCSEKRTVTSEERIPGREQDDSQEVFFLAGCISNPGQMAWGFGLLDGSGDGENSADSKMLKR